MGLPELRSSVGARFEGVLDGVPDLLSYLVFTSLQRHAPSLAERADRLGQRFRGRTWLVGQAETSVGPVDIAYLGSPDRLSRWFLDRLGARPIRAVSAPLTPGSVPCAVELAIIPGVEARSFGRAGWLVLPRYVHHRQELRDDPSGFERKVAERFRASGMTLRLSRDPDDLERFQRELYDPMLRRRHGDRALRTGRALLRLGQRRGGLFIAEREGRAFAGAVGAPSASARSDVEIWALGVAAEAPSGAGLAPILGWVRWARERRFAAVDHLVSLPLYSDGLTRQKLRWGTSLSEPTESRERLALRVHGTGPALASWLGRHSFAACSTAGITRVEAAAPDSLAGIARALAVG